MDWENDSGEYAHHIWRWWTTRERDFPCHALALILVVLSQLSSYSLERAFSHLKLICDRCGDAMYEDMLEIFLFLQYNRDLKELYESILPFSITN